MKNYLLKTLLLLTTLWATNSVAILAAEKTVGSGVAVYQQFMLGTLRSSDYEYWISESDLQNNGMKEGLIKSLSVQIAAIGAGTIADNRTVKLYLANVDWAEMEQNVHHTDLAMWTHCYTKDQFTWESLRADNGGTGKYAVGDWAKFTFNEDSFYYTGKGLLVKICNEGDIASGSNTTYRVRANAPGYNCAYGFGTTATGPQYDNWCATSTTTSSRVSATQRPNFRFDIDICINVGAEAGLDATLFPPNMWSSNYEYFISKSDIESAGGWDGVMKSIAVKIKTSAAQDFTTPRTIRIFMANVNDWTEIENTLHPVDWDAWDQVYQRDQFTLANLYADEHNGNTGSYVDAWATFNFNVDDNKFDYDGDGVLVKFCNEGTSGGSFFNSRGANIAQAAVVGYNCRVGAGANSATQCSSVTTNRTNIRPIFRFGIDLSDTPPIASYNNTVVLHPNLDVVQPSTTNAQILRIDVSTLGIAPMLTVDNFKFDIKTSGRYITAAKLYYTGQSSTFSTTQLLGTVTDFSSSAVDFTITPQPISPVGTYYFWLVYDIKSTLPMLENVLDASFTSFQYTNGAQITTVSSEDVPTFDPDGARSLNVSALVYAPDGNSNPIGSTQYNEAYWGPGQHATGNYVAYLSPYPANEINNGQPGTIENVAYFIRNILLDNNNLMDSNFILMRNAPNSATTTWPTGIFPNSYGYKTLEVLGVNNWLNVWLDNGYQIVKGPFQFPHVNTTNYWLDVALDTPFEYTGGTLEVVFIRYNLSDRAGYYNCTEEPYNEWLPTACFTGSARNRAMCMALINNSASAECPPSPSGDWSTTPTTEADAQTEYRRNPLSARFTINYESGHYFNSGTVFQSSKSSVGVGAVTADVIGTCITLAGKDAEPYFNLKKIKFDGLTFENQILTARLYYTDSDSVFHTKNPIGSPFTVTAANINNIEFNLSNTRLKLGKNYIWLAYSLSSDQANIGKTIDAKVIECVLERQTSTSNTDVDITEFLQTPDPVGNRQIVGSLEGGIYYVGSDYATYGRGYTNLRLAAEAFTNIGVTGNAEIHLTNSVSDNLPAVFGASPFGDNIRIKLTIAEQVTTNITVSNSQNLETASTIALSGISNFSVDGRGKRLTISKTGNSGNAITMLATNYIKIDSVNLQGVTDVLNVSSSSNFDITNNKLGKATNFAINISRNSLNGNILSNLIGGTTSTENIANGISLVGANNNINIGLNNIHSISGVSSNNSAFYINGNVPNLLMEVNIYNNTIGDVAANTNGYASAFEILNASGVRIYHNTVIFNTAGPQRYTSVFYFPTNTCSIITSNNLFSNAVPSTTNTYAQQILMRESSSAFSDANNNVYNGTYAVCRYAGSSTNEIGMEDWKTISNQDNLSNWLNLTAHFVSDNDYHTDGDICGSNFITFDTLNRTLFPNSYSDMDDLRGKNNVLPGKTNAGADEIMLTIKSDYATSVLPGQVLYCQDLAESINLEIDRSFEAWADGVERRFVPSTQNWWITSNGDTLKDENGIQVSIFPYLAIKVPNYTHSMVVKCVSQTGHMVVETGNCNIVIIKEPEIRVIPDIQICYDAGEFTISAGEHIDGVAISLQWQKRTGGQWTNINSQTNEALTVKFANTPAGVALAAGDYRLRLTPYKNCGDLTPYYYSNEINVVVGYPLDTAEITASHSQSDLQTVCYNDNVWFATSIPADAEGTILGYQWEKQNPATGEFYQVEHVFNQTANSDTLKINNVRSEDAGVYRCKVFGCSETNYFNTDAIEFKVKVSSEIIQNPASVLNACLGAEITNEIQVLIAEPYIETQTGTFINQYQWFKDGKPFYRFSDAGDTTSPTNDILYSKRRTDTTYLPFHQLTYTDGASYKLRMIYIDCKGKLDTIFSSPVELFIYGPALLEAESQEVFGVLGGHTTLWVDVHTDMPLEENPLTYKWYRKIGNGDAVAIVDDGRISGANTAQLRINNILQTDLNELSASGIIDYYYCEITDLCSKIIVSQKMQIKTAPNIIINTQPSSVDICATEDVTMQIVATSSDPTKTLYYEWYRTDEVTPILQGTSANSLTLNNVDVSAGGDYYCVVSFEDLPGSNKSSDTLALTVGTTPVVKQEIYPTSELNAGDELKLEVVMTDPTATYTYQWYLNDLVLSGATDSVYLVQNVTEANKGIYHVTVTGTCGETVSSKMNIVFTGIYETEDPNFRITEVAPNPITNDAIISFVLPESNYATLSLLDVSGSKIVELYSGWGTFGTNAVKISDKLAKVSSGVYFVLLESQGRKTTINIVISK